VTSLELFELFVMIPFLHEPMVLFCFVLIVFELSIISSEWESHKKNDKNVKERPGETKGSEKLDSFIPHRHPPVF